MATDVAVAKREPDLAQDLVEDEVAECDGPFEEPEFKLPRHVREHYDAIREKEQTVRQLERSFFDAKRQAKNAKEDFEAADLELRNLIAEGLDPQSKLPFPEEETPADPDAWRSASLDELFLPEKLHDKLVAEGVETIGQLEDLRAEISEGEAKWPKGFGVAKVTAVENAILAWLSDHRDHWGEPVAAAGAETAA